MINTQLTQSTVAVGWSALLVRVGRIIRREIRSWMRERLVRLIEPPNVECEYRPHHRSVSPLCEPAPAHASMGQTFQEPHISEPPQGVCLPPLPPEYETEVAGSRILAYLFPKLRQTNNSSCE